MEWLSANGPTWADRRYWGDRARSLERCGYLKRFDCACGQSYGKASWPCHQRLCPWCASRRAAVQVERIAGRLAQLRAEGTVFTPALVTLTLPDRRSPSLLAGVDQLTERLGQLERRQAWRSAGVLGRVTSIEIKRGALAGLWHPHAHVLVVLPGVWSAEDVAAWGDRVVAAWLVLVDGASRAGQDVRLIREDGIREAVKYSVKASTLVEGPDGRPRSVAAAAADVAEVTEFLRKRRLLRTAGCLYGLLADAEDEAALPEDEPDETPACLACGVPGTPASPALREAPERCENGRWLNRVPRWWCVPYPGVRGWYVQVISADWEAGTPAPALDVDRDVGELLAERLRAELVGQSP